MKTSKLFLPLLLVLPTLLAGMQHPPAACSSAYTELPGELQKYAAPVELHAQLDALDLAELESIGEGVEMRAYVHPVIQGWVFKEWKAEDWVKSDDVQLLREYNFRIFANMLDYADFMNNIITENQFRYIQIPHHYIYIRNGRCFIIAERIYRSCHKNYRALCFEEASELINFIIQAWYLDCNPDNIVITDQGTIAIIDLGYDFNAQMQRQKPLNLEMYYYLNHNIIIQLSYPIIVELFQKILGRACRECLAELEHVDEELALACSGMLYDLCLRQACNQELTTILESCLQKSGLKDWHADVAIFLEKIKRTRS